MDRMEMLKTLRAIVSDATEVRYGVQGQIEGKQLNLDCLINAIERRIDHEENKVQRDDY